MKGGRPDLPSSAEVGVLSPPRTVRPSGPWGALEQRHPWVRLAVAAAWLPVAAAMVMWPLVGALVLVIVVAVAATVRSRRDAVTVLSVYVVVLLGVSARYVFAPLGEVGTLATMGGVAAAVCWAIGRMVPSLGTGWGRQPVRTAILGFWACMLAAYAVAQLRILSPLEASGADRMAIKVVALGGVALLAADGIDSRDRLESLLRRIAMGAAFLACVGILQFQAGIDLAPHLAPPGFTLNAELDTISERADFRRVAGTALHAIEFGVVLTTALPLALHLALTAVGRLRKLQWFGIMVLIGVAIPMSVSRSAVLGLVVGMAAMLPVLSWRRRVILLVGGAAFAVGLRAAIPGLLGTIKALFVDAGTDPSIMSRTMDYDLVTTFVAQAPILGRGLGTFLPRLYDFLDNQLLLTLVEAGVIGLVSLVGVIVVGCSVARGVRRRGVDHTTRSLGQALAACLLASALNFLTFDALSFPINAGLFFLLVGCAGALWRLEAAPAPLPTPAVMDVYRPLVGTAWQPWPDRAMATVTRSPRHVQHLR